MSWFQYLLQANLYLVLLYGFYTLLLRNNTFFRLNRIYLLSSGIIAFLMPVLQFESIKALFITEQVRQTTRTIGTVIYSAPQVYSAQENTWTLTDWLLAVYIAGIILFVSRFLLQLFVVLRKRSGYSSILKAHSFFGKIVVSDHIEGRKIIMEHEKVHVSQWHSADVILFEVISIVSWFNPVVYAYKKALKYIHEFIADEAVAKNQFTKEDYSLLILSNVFGIRTQELSNSFFNQSLLKRRIIMLHKTKSKRITLLKYSLCVPLLAAMLIFSSSTVKIEDYSEPIKNIKLGNFIKTDPDNQSDEYYKLFLRRNPQIKNLAWTTKPSVTVYLKDGKKEVYDLDNDGHIKNAEVKYGELPSSPPPPPALSTPASQIDKIVLSDEPQPDPVVQMEMVQVLPQFPGGPQGWVKFVGDNYNYPKMARENNVSGKVIISFIIEKDGSLTDFRVVRDFGFGTGEEAVRMMKTSPKWTPGIQNGLKVRVTYYQPIILSLS
ncbi:MAG TPA: hypothetical protein DIT07_14455 [Sphingobacteriaceae bacterium]|nr:hypothetical protein [Sphingobacteriaceae bacterium]